MEKIEFGLNGLTEAAQSAKIIATLRDVLKAGGAWSDDDEAEFETYEDGKGEDVAQYITDLQDALTDAGIARAGYIAETDRYIVVDY